MKQTQHLFPYLLARVVGGDIDAFAQTNLNHTIKNLEKVADLQKKSAVIEEKLSEQLHTFIATVADKKTRNHLIQLRRDIHNDRMQSLFPEIEKVLPRQLTSLLKQYLKLHHAKKQLLMIGENFLDKETMHSKKALLKLLKQPNFHNGMTLSSSTLPESLKKYLHATDKAFPKVERSLIKYLSRMYTKPSPFSTFTSLTLATFLETEEILATNKKITRTSHVALNHFLFHYLVGLLVQNKNLHGYFNLTLNPTIQLSENQFVFITNNFNREAVQRITQTQALQVIFTAMQKKKQWQYNELTNHLHTTYFPSTTIAEISAYLHNLLVYGFVEYDLGISGTDPQWDEKLSLLVKPLAKKFPYLADLRHMLAYLRKATKQYEKASSQKREQLLSDAFLEVKQTCLQLHSAAELPKKERRSFEEIDTLHEPKKKKKEKKDAPFTHRYNTEFEIKPHTLWYEDTTLAARLDLSTTVEKQLAILGELLARMGWFDTCIEELYKMADFFLAHYKPTEHIDLLQFYEAYYREKKGKKKKSSQSASLKAIHKRNKDFMDIFTKNVTSRLLDDTIHVTEQDVSHIPHVTTHASFGAFFHLMPSENKEPVIVVNNTVPGFGKLFSRFVSLFPHDFNEALKDWNIKGNNDALLAEITDASIFNANLHMSLMPYEITAPGSYTTLPRDQQVPITDIEIIFQKSDAKVHLLHKQTQKEIFAFDLGFQGSQGRSELYSFLSKYTRGSHHHILPLAEAINKVYKKGKEKEKIVVLPRIMYKKSIVLQRKAWEITKEALPMRVAQESDWPYLQKVTSFQKELALPDEIFVKHLKDKPQYINFTNPFLVMLFEKVIEKMKSGEKLKLEEMLPNSQQLLPLQDKKLVTEFLAQWYYLT